MPMLSQVLNQAPAPGNRQQPNPQLRHGFGGVLPNPELLRRIRGINRGIARERLLYGVQMPFFDYADFLPVTDPTVQTAQEAKRVMGTSGAMGVMQSQFARELQKSLFEQDLQKILAEKQAETELLQRKMSNEERLLQLENEIKNKKLEQDRDLKQQELQTQLEIAKIEAGAAGPGGSNQADVFRALAAAALDFQEAQQNAIMERLSQLKEEAEKHKDDPTKLDEIRAEMGVLQSKLRMMIGSDAATFLDPLLRASGLPTLRIPVNANE